MRSTTRFIAGCWLIASLAVAFPAVASGGTCVACHAAVRPAGGHAVLACERCHGGDGARRLPPGDAVGGGCAAPGCHAGHAPVLEGPMATRAREKAFAGRTGGRFDERFFESACSGCHVASCRDCHPGGAHAAARPGTAECLRCHAGDATGGEYLGLAPREENARFDRGPAKGGERFLRMLPDVHAEAGMPCGACHSMKSLAAGRKASKGCGDCHSPSLDVIEHAIPEHMAGMTCQSCHAAWAPQAYGSWRIRTGGDPEARAAFGLRHEKGGYLESVYERRQDAPPLGVDASGRVSPIVPRFILFYSDVRPGAGTRPENRMVAAEWKALFPHTVRRGTVTCEGCHEAPDRWMREPPAARIRDLAADGLPLRSFRSREGQRVVNGAFLGDARFARLGARSARYKTLLVEKWKRLTDRVDGSSGR